MDNQQWDINIDRIGADEISQPTAGDIGSRKFEYNFEDKKVTIPQEMHDTYKKAINPELPFSMRWNNFWTASSKAGRGAKAVKDAALLFLPKWVGAGYKTVDDFILNQITYDMSSKESKSTSKSSTVITFGLLFLAGVLMQLGWIPADMVELSPDAQWVATLSGVVGVLLRLITDKPVKLGKNLRMLVGRETS